MQNKGYLSAKRTSNSDEVYTPEIAIEPIIKYIKKFYKGIAPEVCPKIWCPFDKENESNYIKILREHGYKIIASHIDNGQNFFNYEPNEEYGIIISNPPFSIKDDILKRLYELDKPYAMLLPLPSLQGQKRFKYIKDCEVLIFDKRINYFKNIQTKEIQKGVSFASIYVCKNFLPSKLIFEELKGEKK